MRVQVNQLIYDDADELCKCYLETALGKGYAFVQCIDTGMDGTHRFIKRYWGEYDVNNPEVSMIEILSYGGKWPQLPN